MQELFQGGADYRMIPILYSTSGKLIGTLSDCTRCYVTQERDGLYEAEIDYPMNSEYFSRIEKGCYILVKPDDISQPQKMRVYKPVKPLYGIATFHCEHERYRLNGVPVARGHYSGNPAAILNSMLSSVDGASEFTFWSDISTVKDIDLNTPMTVGQMMGGTEGSVLDRFGGEYEFDNHTIKLHSQRGQQKTAEIRYAKNLTGFTCETDISTAYTHVYPFYYSETDNQYVELPAKKIAVSGTSGLPYRCYMLDLSSDFETAPTAAQLESKARTYISSNHLGEISRNYKVSFVPLWQTEEYKNVASLERCVLCDTVPVVHEKAGEKINAKIIRTVYDSLAERYVEMELGNAVSSFSNTVSQSINQVQESISKTKSFLQIVVGRETAKITGNRGGYVVLYDSDGDGEPDEILIMNTPSILTATKVWRWNVAGLGYSSTGYAGPYRTAITMDGSIVADFITTGSLNASLITSGVLLADLIKAGTISDQTEKISISMTNGRISMKIDNGNNMVLWTNGLTFYGENDEVLTSMFVSTNKKGVVTANTILVGKRDYEKISLQADNSTASVTVDGPVSATNFIGTTITARNVNVMDKLSLDLYGLEIQGLTFIPTLITDGFGNDHTVLAQI